ncbi:MAG: tetratricopeptide repeat protein, partial [Byssovorax sp.]
MRARYWTLTMAVVLGISATAYAQPAGPQAPPADVHAQAEEQFHRARTAMNEQRYAQALDLLRASQAAEFGRGKLLNIAVCEEALGQLTLALGHYEMVAAQLPDTDERTAVVASKIAALRPRIPTLKILVNGAAPGRWLTIDGQEVSASMSPAGMRLNPGAHSIDIVEAGFHRDVILKEG